MRATGMKVRTGFVPWGKWGGRRSPIASPTSPMDP